MSFVVDSAGSPALLMPNELPAARGRVRLAFQSYPALLMGDGELPWELQAPGRGADLTHRDSRLAVGVLADGSVIIALTRFTGLGSSAETLPWGPTVIEMADFMRELGCRRAMMLDGGISSQMSLRYADGTTRHWSNWRMKTLSIRRASRPEAEALAPLICGPFRRALPVEPHQPEPEVSYGHEGGPGDIRPNARVDLGEQRPRKQPACSDQQPGEDRRDIAASGWCVAGFCHESERFYVLLEQLRSRERHRRFSFVLFTGSESRWFQDLRSGRAISASAADADGAKQPGHDHVQARGRGGAVRKGGSQDVLERTGWRESAGRLTFDDVMDPSRIPCIDS